MWGVLLGVFQQGVSDAVEWFYTFRKNPARRRALLGVCSAGALCGYYYYLPQLSITPAHLWLFVPDCPLFITLFVGVLLLCERRIRSGLLDGLVLFGLVKYGVWTLFVMLLYFDVYLSRAAPLELGLFVAHIGMVLCAPTLIKGLEKRLFGWHILLLTFAFIGMDVVDYVVGTHPIIPSSELGLVGAFAVGSSLAIGAVLYALCARCCSLVQSNHLNRR